MPVWCMRTLAALSRTLGPSGSRLLNGVRTGGLSLTRRLQLLLRVWPSASLQRLLLRLLLRMLKLRLRLRLRLLLLLLLLLRLLLLLLLLLLRLRLRLRLLLLLRQRVHGPLVRLIHRHVVLEVSEVVGVGGGRRHRGVRGRHAHHVLQPHAGCVGGERPHVAAARRARRHAPRRCWGLHGRHLR